MYIIVTHPRHAAIKQNVYSMRGLTQCLLSAFRYQHVAQALLKPVFLSEESMRPDMTWAAAIPKDSPDKADSLQPNPNGFMELNALPLMLDVISMLQVDDESIMYLKQWLQCVPESSLHTQAHKGTVRPLSFTSFVIF